MCVTPGTTLTLRWLPFCYVILVGSLGAPHEHTEGLWAGAPRKRKEALEGATVLPWPGFVPNSVGFEALEKLAIRLLRRFI